MYRHETRIRLADTDAAGVLYFASLLRIAHEAYEAWFESAGLPIATVIRDPQGQRLGDRVAHTQVVEGLGAKEFVSVLQKGLLDEIQLQRDPIEPVDVKRGRRSA